MTIPRSARNYIKQNLQSFIRDRELCSIWDEYKTGTVKGERLLAYYMQRYSGDMPLSERYSHVDVLFCLADQIDKARREVQ